MEIALLIIAVLLSIVGCVGCVVPIIPGPILTYAGYLCIYFVDGTDISVTSLVIFGILTIVVTVLDFILPSYLTKKFGGTKAGERGALIGVVAGLFLGPLGVIFGPFVGALVGELIHDKSNKKRAFKSGLGSFISFFVGTGIKLVVAIWMTVYVIIEVCKIAF